jgi:hypothetical protein
MSLRQPVKAGPLTESHVSHGHHLTPGGQTDLPLHDILLSPHTPFDIEVEP